MYRVIIADDDFLVRTYLKQMIPWQDQGFLIIGDAKNGQEAMQLLQQEEADILITDVSMPIMNGIELTRWIKNNSPTTHVLVLSCHDDFVYVKEAMKLGIDDYILKNDLTPETLLEALGKISESLNESSTKSNDNLEAEKQILIEKNNLEQELLRQFDEGTNLSQLEQLSFKLPAALLILPKDWSQREQDFTELEIETFFNAFAEMSGNICRNVGEDKVKSFSFTSQDSSHWGILIDFADGNDISKIDNLLNDIVKRLKISSKRYFNLDLECNILPPEKSLKILAQQWQQKLIELQANQEENQLHPAIRSALKYINEHYREDLSQTTVAEEVYLNPAYFSTLFKRSLGKGFSEYLMDLRMEHVKHRLSTGTERIKDIAMTEGFNDYQYFCKLFKKITELNPSQYRQKFFH